MTNLTIEEQFNQILMCYEAYIYGELGHHYPVTNQNKFTRKKAKQQLLTLLEEEKIKELELLKTMYGSFADNTLGNIIVIKAVETSRIDDRLQALKQESNNGHIKS